MVLMLSRLKERFSHREVEVTGDNFPTNDLSIALMFLPHLPNITLVVDRREYVPYVKRMLVRALGQPGKNWGDEFYYDGKRIKMVSLLSGEEKLLGIPSNEVFYLGTWEDERGAE